VVSHIIWQNFPQKTGGPSNKSVVSVAEAGKLLMKDLRPAADLAYLRRLDKVIRNSHIYCTG